jgi:hypothetical protein
MKAIPSDAGRLLPRLASILAGCSVAGAPVAATPPAAVPDAVDWPTAAVDLSFLNAAERPAGRHGFVHAKGPALVFDDGSIARFWGANITAATLFKSDAAAVKDHARRLSRLGFNLVRLHHHDSYWTSPNVFGAQAPGTRQLDAAMLEKIDWWVKCLKDEGIYVWIDLHVQRKLTAVDGIDDFDEIAKGRASVELKGFNYVNASIERAMREFSDAYLGHVNVYTRVALKDEPAVAAVLVTNENDLTQHYGNALLPNQKVPRHSERFMAEAKRFAAEHHLPDDRVARAWEYGPSKIFLNDLEQRFDARMLAHLRGIGVKVPIATTSLWGWQMASLPALTSGDVIDVHAYENTGFLARDPSSQGTALQMAANAQVTGMPLTVTEWNISELSSPDRHALPLVIAATASHQGWDALMHYAYAQVPLQLPGKPSNWHAFNDPSRLAMLPAAALMYRRQDVREATTTYAWTPSVAELFDAPPSGGVSTALRLASEHGRLVTAMPAVDALPWLKAGKPPADALPASRAPAAAAGELKSDTGELDRRWKDGIFTIDTPRTQAVAGQLGARTLALSRATFTLQNPSASAAVQSLDGKPVGESDHLLVSLATDSVPVRADELPFMAQPVRGDIEIAAAAGLVLAAAPEGVQLRYERGRHVIHIDSKEPVHWVQLQRPAVSRP